MEAEVEAEVCMEGVCHPPRSTRGVVEGLLRRPWGGAEGTGGGFRSRPRPGTEGGRERSVGRGSETQTDRGEGRGRGGEGRRG